MSLSAGCLATGLSGFGTSLSVAQYVLCLCLLGLGWNLCYIGGTRLLVESHNEVETAKVQAINEFSIQVANTLAAFLAGPLLNEYGWEAVVWVGVPCVGITATVALAWKVQRCGGQLPPEGIGEGKGGKGGDLGQ